MSNLSQQTSSESGNRFEIVRAVFTSANQARREQVSYRPERREPRQELRYDRGPAYEPDRRPERAEPRAERLSDRFDAVFRRP